VNEANEFGSGRAPARLVDPEPPDTSEQSFEASLKGPGPRFVVQEEATGEPMPVSVGAPSSTLEDAVQQPDAVGGDVEATAEAPVSEPDPDRWRQEVAARVNHYRARRRVKGPRYPSLHLPFETPPASTETWGTQADASWVHHNLALESVVNVAPESFAPAFHEAAEPARIIEFPRSQLMPPLPLEELAEPVLGRPRILDVPEVAARGPALGGILLATPPAETASRPAGEAELPTASRVRRAAAALVDGGIVLLAVAAFGQVAMRLAGGLPPWKLAVVGGLVVAAFFWFLYQFLMLVYNGRTPGLRAARLEVCRFDGTAASRSLRRWRVLTSVLSVAALGLGYAWCWLDEEQLCWHDRITRTHLRRRASE
jgi:uncharacterized RDD family membrane protein YckC